MRPSSDAQCIEGSAGRSKAHHGRRDAAREAQRSASREAQCSTCSRAGGVAVQSGAHHAQLGVDDAPDHVVRAPGAAQVLHLHLLVLHMHQKSCCQTQLPTAAISMPGCSTRLGRKQATMLWMCIILCIKIASSLEGQAVQQNDSLVLLREGWAWHLPDAVGAGLGLREVPRVPPQLQEYHCVGRTQCDARLCGHQ